MVLTQEQSHSLANLYDGQEISVDRLGGTTNLDSITARFNDAYDLDFSRDEILSRLIAMRKSGFLNGKRDKTITEKPKPTWPPFKDGKYLVPLTLEVRGNGVSYTIFYMRCVGEQTPVNRQEVYDFLIRYPKCAIPPADWTDGTDREDREYLARTLNLLFPELA